MVSQVIIKMGDDGRVDVQSNIRNNLMLLGLLELAKKAVMQSTEQPQKEKMISVPHIKLAKGN